MAPILNLQELAKRMAHASSLVKLICGTANNAAIGIMLEAKDHAKQCRNYRQKVKHLFKMAIDEMHRYELTLVVPYKNRMFGMEDMSPEVRKKYGDISDRQYYDFWCGMGNPVYKKTRPLITSLWNKYRLSLEKEGIREAEHVAWVMVAQAALELSVLMYRRAVEECVTGYELDRKMVEQVFHQFSLEQVAKRWKAALYALCPCTDEAEPDEIDRRNIEQGLLQLTDAWVDPTLLYTSTMENVEDFPEVFRTKGELRKSLHEIAEVKQETMRNLAKS